MNGDYYIMQITEDGPSRIEGVKGYQTEASAIKAVEMLLRGNKSHARLTIMKAVGTYWLDPKPRVLSDQPECE